MAYNIIKKRHFMNAVSRFYGRLAAGWPVFPGDAGAMPKVPVVANYQVRALDRALDILELFLAEPELSLLEISARAHLPKSTVFKLLAVLEQRGYVCQGQREGTYRIGLQAFRTGRCYLVGKGGLTQIARPTLEDLARRFSRSLASLGVLYRDRAIILDTVESGELYPLRRIPGAEMPLHATALGKALLSGLPDNELDLILARLDLLAVTPRTITDHAALRAHLDLVRRQGYALDDEESGAGIICLASVVRDHTGQMVGAISISAVKAALEADLPQAAQRITLAAREVSRLLGFIVPAADV